MHFTNFCTKREDYVRITDGNGSWLTSPSRMSGSLKSCGYGQISQIWDRSQEPDYIVSETETVYVEFFTDSWAEWWGWRLEWSVNDKP